MKKSLLALTFVFALLVALAGCGKKEDAAPAPAPAAAAPSGDNGLLWGLGGFLLGRAMSPSPSPQVVQQPVYVNRTTVIHKQAPAPAPKPTPVPVKPSVVKPPVVSTSPSTFSAPKPAATSYSGPKSYSSTSMSRPSYSGSSFRSSSGRR